MERTLHDVKKWKAEEKFAIGENWLKVLKGLGILVLAVAGGFILMNLLGVKLPWETKERVVERVVESTGGDVTKIPVLVYEGFLLLCTNCKKSLKGLLHIK